MRSVDSILVSKSYKSGSIRPFKNAGRLLALNLKNVFGIFYLFNQYLQLLLVSLNGGLPKYNMKSTTPKEKMSAFFPS